MKRMLRQSTKPEDAERLTREIKEIDYALLHLIDRTDCMTLAAAGDLVAMQRRLRKLRYQIESERAGPSGRKAIRVGIARALASVK